MPGSRNSTSISSPKPVNIFYVWYAELCRRSNTTPLAVVKPAKPKNECVLDFTSDRIKADEWAPILHALRNDTSLHVIAIRSRIECKFLYDVDTEEKVRCMKRKFGTLWTAYILNCLVNSLTCCITRTSVLTCLELDGLPITAEYVLVLIEGLRRNKTVRILSFKNCPIGDAGCHHLCDCLRYIPNIEVLNLSSCNLGVPSAEALAKVIRSQQINRYCESWHSSLRYEDPEIGAMVGLKRISLNNNPHIGNEGLLLILNELDDDLWIKAIDMQRCNITERVANRLVDVVDYSRSLEIADFRNNDQLNSTTIEKIFNILKSKNRFGYECEYQWCLSSTTLPNESSVYELLSSSYISSSLQKSKSAPFKDTECRSDFKLRRTKTFAIMNNKVASSPKIDKKDINLARKEVLELNAQLQSEITKRMETEKKNVELKEKLKSIKNASKEIKKNGECNFNRLLNVLQNVVTDSSDGSSTERKEIEIKMPSVSLKKKDVSARRSAPYPTERRKCGRDVAKAESAKSVSGKAESAKQENPKETHIKVECVKMECQKSECVKRDPHKSERRKSAVRKREGFNAQCVKPQLDKLNIIKYNGSETEVVKQSSDSPEFGSPGCNTMDYCNAGYSNADDIISGCLATANAARKPVEFVFPTGGSRLAQNLFENLIKKSGAQCEDSDEEDLISVYCETNYDRQKEDPSKMLAKIEEEEYDDASNVSLMRYIREIKGESNHNGKINGIMEAPKQNGYKKDVNGYNKKDTNRRNGVQKTMMKVPPVR